jgi:hypothetical protein
LRYDCYALKAFLQTPRTHFPALALSIVHFEGGLAMRYHTVTLLPAVLVAAGCAAAVNPSPPATIVASTATTRLDKSLQNTAPWLAVSDPEDQNVSVFDKAYKLVQETSATQSRGIFYDGKGRLYAAQTTDGTVGEYANGKLIFSYAHGLQQPMDVAVDSKQNVYVADFNNGAPGVVAEFSQQSSTPSASCNTDLVNYGVALDARGNVFVSGMNGASGQGSFIEFKGGLTGCHATTLRVTDGAPGDLKIDNHENIIAADPYVGVVRIPPPYSKVASTIVPATYVVFGDSLTADDKYIAVAELYIVNIYRYPSGEHVTGFDMDAATGVAFVSDLPKK